MAPIVLLSKLTTRLHYLHYLHCYIALLALSVSIELVSSSARVTSVKSTKGLGRTDGQTSGPKDRTPGLPGSDKYFLYCFPAFTFYISQILHGDWPAVARVSSPRRKGTSHILYFENIPTKIICVGMYS